MDDQVERTTLQPAETELEARRRRCECHFVGDTEGDRIDEEPLVLLCRPDEPDAIDRQRALPNNIRGFDLTGPLSSMIARSR